MYNFLLLNCFIISIVLFIYTVKKKFITEIVFASIITTLYSGCIWMEHLNYTYYGISDLSYLLYNFAFYCLYLIFNIESNKEYFKCCHM